ncbi:hypothetical protein ACH5RR_026889 [Cinchona calisaya]|uniref:Uncharacterized protein n=1 Tax=Cinchona calisaya TaxID=153742 RepID=A0ABD2Z7S9_9GENT
MLKRDEVESLVKELIVGETGFIYIEMLDDVRCPQVGLNRPIKAGLCPLKSNFRFRCVSKSWNRHLSESFFRDAYISSRKESQVPPPVLGFLRKFPLTRTRTRARLAQESRNNVSSELSGISFLPYKNKSSAEQEDHPVIKLNFAKNFGSYRCYTKASPGFLPDDHINDSCSLLSNYQNINYTVRHVPASPGFLSNEYCDNDFTVILPYLEQDCNYQSLKIDFLLVEIYYLNTGLWESIKIIGGTFFWYTDYYDDGFVAYDQDRSNDRLQLIKLPEIWCSGYYRGNFSPSLCQSSNNFLQCAVLNYESFLDFRVCTLPKLLSGYGYDEVIKSGEWIPTYTVNFGMLDATLKDLRLENWVRHGYLVLPMDFHPSNPLLLVVKVSNKFFLCDIETPQLLDLISDKGIFSITVPYVLPHWPPPPIPKMKSLDQRFRSVKCLAKEESFLIRKDI